VHAATGQESNLHVEDKVSLLDGKKRGGELGPKKPRGARFGVQIIGFQKGIWKPVGMVQGWRVVRKRTIQKSPVDQSMILLRSKKCWGNARGELAGSE